MRSQGDSPQAVSHGAATACDFIADNAPCAIIEWDAELRVRRWSAGAMHLFGWDAAEVAGRRIDDWTFIHANDQRELQQALLRLAEQDTGRERLPCLNYTQDGTLIHTE